MLTEAVAALDYEAAPWSVTVAEHPEDAALLESVDFAATWPGAHDFEDRLRGVESVCLIDRCSRLAGPLSAAGTLCFAVSVPPPWQSLTEYLAARVGIAGKLDAWDLRQLRRQLWLAICSVAVVVAEPAKGRRHV